MSRMNGKKKQKKHSFSNTIQRKIRARLDLLTIFTLLMPFFLSMNHTLMALCSALKEKISQEARGKIERSGGRYTTPPPLSAVHKSATRRGDLINIVAVCAPLESVAVSTLPRFPAYNTTNSTSNSSTNSTRSHTTISIFGPESYRRSVVGAGHVGLLEVLQETLLFRLASLGRLVFGIL